LIVSRVLELGCGKGEHSLAFAATNPDILYMGVDRKSQPQGVAPTGPG
jgi:tRNA (guanine-N7-)-methyltransferase